MVTANTSRKEKSSSNDLYTTPREALDAIWDKIEDDIDKSYPYSWSNPKILEPCAGLHDITEYLEDKIYFNISVETNELYPLDHLRYDYTNDFLAEDNGLGMYDLICTNPPYNKAKEFILKGFEHAPVQWHFLRLAFLEGQARFSDLFSLGKLSDVYIFSYRISCPKGVEREDSGNAVAYAWFRWDSKYCGQPKLHWLTKANLRGE